MASRILVQIIVHIAPTIAVAAIVWLARLPSERGLWAAATVLAMVIAMLLLFAVREMQIANAREERRDHMLAAQHKARMEQLRELRFAVLSSGAQIAIAIEETEPTSPSRPLGPKGSAFTTLPTIHHEDISESIPSSDCTLVSPGLKQQG